MGSKTLLTVDDLLRLPEPDLPHELRRGVLRLVTPAISAHGAVSARLLGALAQHVYTHDLGALFTAEAGFLLERDPDTLLCPDVAFVSRERLPAGGLEPRFLELAPDLAVEVLTPSSRPGEVRTKVADYLRLGVRAVWVVDPARRTVRIHSRLARMARRTSAVLLAEDDMLDGGEVVPGFRCRIAELFADLRR
ncbi:MAG TPA: Uma2 family endonuclease [Thermoanaerobaculia bacterium]